MKVPLYLPAPHSCTRGGICRVPKPWNNYFAHSVTLMLLVTPFSKDTASISFIDKKKKKKIGGTCRCIFKTNGKQKGRNLKTLIQQQQQKKIAVLSRYKYTLLQPFRMYTNAPCKTCISCCAFEFQALRDKPCTHVEAYLFHSR